MPSLSLRRREADIELLPQLVSDIDSNGWYYFLPTCKLTSRAAGHDPDLRRSRGVLHRCLNFQRWNVIRIHVDLVSPLDHRHRHEIPHEVSSPLLQCCGPSNTTAPAESSGEPRHGKYSSALLSRGLQERALKPSTAHSIMLCYVMVYDKILYYILYFSRLYSQRVLGNQGV